MNERQRARSPDIGNEDEGLKGRVELQMKDADQALQTLGDLEQEHVEPTRAVSRRLLWKIDLIILPFLCLVYGVQFLDRTSLSYASIMGIQRDLKLVGQDYSWMSSVFFFGFLGSEFITGRALQRLPIGKYLGICTIIWGIFSACFAALNTYGQAIALRFVLGMLQACVSPALILIVSQWYTKAEQSARTGVWVSFSGFAQIFGGLVAYRIAKDTAENRFAITGWRIVFLVFGCMTIFLGVLVVIFVPDSQRNAWWLSPQDRMLAVQRIRVNQQGIGNRTFKVHQFVEALKDPMTWMIAFYAVAANIPNGGLTNFFSQLIVSFDFTPRQSLLYGCPAGAVAIISILVWGFLSQRFGYRILLGTFAMIIATIGAILIVALPLHNNVGRLVGYYLTTALPASEAAVISLISTNVAGYTKKTTVSAIFFVGYCVGNIIGPQTFRTKDAPRFMPAEITIIALFGACVIDMVLLFFYLSSQNRNKEKETMKPGYRKEAGSEFWDLTDRENKDFVYAL